MMQGNLRFARRLLITMLALSLVTGCAYLEGRPLKQAFAPAEQLGIQSANHWNSIAEDAAAHLAALKLQNSSEDLRLFVENDSSDPFSQAFKGMLQTQLNKLGFSVSTHRQGALVVRIETQLIRHAEPPKQIPQLGELSQIGAGILVWRKFVYGHDSVVSAANSAAAVLVGTDLLHAYARLKAPTLCEFVVTTSVSSGDVFVLRKTDVYYIEDHDRRLYNQQPSQPKTIGVVGS